MSIETQRAFLSSPYRVWFIRNLRCSVGEKWLYQKVSPISDERFPIMRWDFRFHAGTTLQMVYMRRETHTIVARVHLGNAEGSSVVMKVFRVKEPPKSGATRLTSQEMEIRCLHLFSSLVAHHITPHFALPVHACHIMSHQVPAVLHGLDSKSVQRIVKTGQYMVLISERANGGSMTQLVTKILPGLRRPHMNYVLTCVLYQVIYTLACLHMRIPSFRHNDLHTSNVLLQAMDIEALDAVRADRTHYVRYLDETNRPLFIDLRTCPYRVLIWDHFYSSVSTADAKKWDLTPCTPADTHLGNGSDPYSRVHANQYYDVNILLDTTEHLLKRSKQWKHLGRHLREFFADALPSAYKCMAVDKPHKHRNTIKLSSCQHTSARDLLSHHVFEQLRQPLVTGDPPLEAYEQRRHLPTLAFPDAPALSLTSDEDHLSHR